MLIERDTLVIVDIESTCWKNNNAPDGQSSEIIEIGICSLEFASGDIDDKRSIFVKPTESTISPFCTELTTITPELVFREGIAFEAACQILQDEYATKNRLWLSWGNYDRRMFIEQCARRNVEYPFSENHCNLKNLFANIYGNRLGMKAALNKIKLDLQGTHHRGDDDAYNIARILAYLLDTHGQDLLNNFWR
jgi:inhibitor of KinA sporulation pathway (predicted exonuclease)